MDKSPDAFRTISEVAEHLETPAHVLRFWESRFPQIRPVKRAGGRRYYRPSDVSLLTGIKRLLHDEGMTIRGVQKILREQGVRHVSGLSGEDQIADPQDDVFADAEFAKPVKDQPADVVVALKPIQTSFRPAPGLEAVMAKVVDKKQVADAPVPTTAPPATAPVQGALLLTPAPSTAVETTSDADSSDDERARPAAAMLPDDPVPVTAGLAGEAGPADISQSAVAAFPEASVDDDFGDDDDSDAGAVTPLAARIRALPSGASAVQVGAELLSVVARLQALRDRMAEAARPGQS